MTPISLNRVLLPSVLHDLSRHGYEVVRNPKWMNGSTIEIENMGRAPEKFAKDGAVKAGKAALAKLEASAANKN